MNGYFQVERSLLDCIGADDKLTAADFRILMIAMRDTRLPGDSVALGIDYLTNGTGLDRSTVIRSRRHLEILGYLISGGKGHRGLSLYAVATGGVGATPKQATGGVDATCRTDATGGVGATGRGGVDATGTGGVDATQRETGNIETTTYAQNNEKPPSLSVPAAPSEESNDQGKLEPTSIPQGTETPPQSPSPARPPKPAVAMGDAGFIVPDLIRQTWATAFPGVDIDREAAKAFAWCQNNPRKAPKKDYGRFLNGWLGRAEPGGSQTAPQGDDSIGYLLHKLDHVEAKHGADVARRYDAKAREFNSTIRADEWLKREIECRTA